MKLPIYLDYAATTPVDERVLKKMDECCCIEGCFGNPASLSHQYGRDAKQLVDTARQQIADLVNAKSQEIIFTSGATESDNLAIKGIAYAYQNKGKHIITCKTEHKAVLDSCKFLEKNGFRVTYLPVMNNGLINLNDLNNAISAETILVSIMHVNNETGVIQDINAIGNICREKNIIFHVDAAQSAGKLAIDLQKLPVDLMSFSAHKIYGPKGIGALYVKPQVKLEPLIHGGGHENGMRSGTLATQQIVGMGEAFHIAKEDMLEDSIRIKNLRDKLWQGISALEGININGDLQARSDTHLNIRVDYIDGGAILMALTDLAISMGSACNSSSIEPSFVLRAMGSTDEQAHASVRISIGRFTTDEEIDFAIHHFKEGIEWLRSMSPLWLERKNG